jgi:hypothetical protein
MTEKFLRAVFKEVRGSKLGGICLGANISKALFFTVHRLETPFKKTSLSFHGFAS